MSASAVAVLSDGNRESSGKHCKCYVVSIYCMEGDGSGEGTGGRSAHVSRCNGHENRRTLL
jgi:hypothetical protein